MTPAQRCDEIIRMIDEVLGAGEPGSLQARAEDGPLDRQFPTARPALLP
jgi:hypothetical protein